MDNNNSADNWINEGYEPRKAAEPASQAGEAQNNTVAASAEPTQPGSVAAPNTTQSTDMKQSTKLCIISLICHYGAGFIASAVGAFLGFFSKAGISESGTLNSALPVGGISLISVIASWVLMIIARKDKSSTFAKVVMWIYIIELLLGALAIFAFIFLFMSLITAIGS